jgi:rod shape-determining protein MreC
VPIYTPGRRRAIILLLLSSLLLLTIDLRGSSLLDTARDAYGEASRPFESAAEVVARPIRNAWRGITRYDALEEQNQQLREARDADRSIVITASGVISEYYALLAKNELSVPGDYERVTAQVIGPAANNVDQIVEINRGSDDGIRVGMPVVNQAGLVGTVTTPLSPHRASVRLLTDPNFYLAVKIVAAETPVFTTTTTITPTTVGVAAPPPDASGGAEPTTTTSAPAAATTTTVVPPDPRRDTGELHGQGPDDNPTVEFIADDPAFGRVKPGDVVFTTGGRTSKAPEGLIVGTVFHVTPRSPAEGPIVEVQPLANVDNLLFVDVLLYQPETEASATGND